ncbi:MAG TPA: TspO/MBR family protein [Plantibacter sp.]|uniref:TspO/MBR family protein n=1 Tax=unclassified Plantibacter TaxID=2624265 RepID=UPI002B71A900|nr:TspO/MBR family protein [Plantibacter sp.]
MTGATVTPSPDLALIRPRLADPAWRSALALVLFLVIAFAVAAFGSLSTFQNVDGWYADADKAAWNPPNAVFGPVWSILYPLMAVAAWLVWRRRRAATPEVTDDASRALAFYVLQLVLNSLWTPFFFGLYPFIGAPALWIALVIIILLDIAVLATMLAFWEVSRLAAVLLIPYWAWVLFATTLNWALAAQNS